LITNVLLRLVVLPKNILQYTRSRLKCWWITKKININILIAKGGCLSPPPGCAFECYQLNVICGESPRHKGSHTVLKVLNCEIGFEDLENVLNIAKTYIKYWKSMEIPNSPICFIQILLFTVDGSFAEVFCILLHE